MYLSSSREKQKVKKKKKKRVLKESDTETVVTNGLSNKQSSPHGSSSAPSGETIAINPAFILVQKLLRGASFVSMVTHLMSLLFLLLSSLFFFSNLRKPCFYSSGICNRLVRHTKTTMYKPQVAMFP